MKRMVAAGAVMLGGILSAFLLAAAPEAPHAVWREVAWPFPADPWGKGRAFRCDPADCGAAVSLYVRPKLGFCNCLTGIAGDDDLDRMGDLALLGAEPAPLGDGRAIAVGWMKGRARAYAAKDGGVISIAFNDRCDMVVATAMTATAMPAAVEGHVIAFLNTAPMLDWTKQKLGI